MKREYLLTILFILFSASLLALGLRGLPGNPTSIELSSPKWKENGPFELSPERGRFVLLYSVAEDKSLQFSKPLADFAMPDLALSEDGKYVSMFTPGVSFLALPGYYLGKYYQVSQAGAFAVIALFTLFNIILIRAISVRLGAHPMAANLGAMTFAFATPAFAYAVTFYQHQISTFTILACVYLLLRHKGLKSLVLIWFLAAFSIVVDNPNFFLMIPIALYALGRIILPEKSGEGLQINIKLMGFLTLIFALIPLGLLLWFNQASHGNPFELPGTLRNARIQNEPSADMPVAQKSDSAQTLENTPNGKSALGFFQTRNLSNGFYTHFASPDRGIFWFAPVIILGILGLYFVYQRSILAGNLVLAIAGINVLIYSMWGDPYGGWAFGSRYLIPMYALLGIGLAMALSEWRKKIIFLAIFYLFFGYSAWINTLGALTSDSNPPKIEIQALEKITGKEEKYTYERNWQYLQNKGTNSFVYQSALKDKMTPMTYFETTAGIVIAGAFVMLVALFLFGAVRQEGKLGHKNKNSGNRGMILKKMIKLIEGKSLRAGRKVMCEIGRLCLLGNRAKKNILEIYSAFIAAILSKVFKK